MIFGCKQEGLLAIANSSVGVIIENLNKNLNQVINYSEETILSAINLFSEL